MGKIKSYAIHIEFQERGSPHVHSFIWIFSAPNIQNETAYIKFTEKTINAQLPDHLKDPELFELVILTKFKHTLKLAGNATRMNFVSHMVDILLRKQLLQNHLILNLAMKKKFFYITKASQKLS